MKEQAQAKPYREVEKPPMIRAVDLARSLLMIRDSLRAMSAGQGHFIAALSGQLRGLLMEKSRQNESLLPGVVAALGMAQPRFFCMPEAGDARSPIVASGTVTLQLTTPKIELNRTHPLQEEVDLDGMLDRKVILVMGQTFSGRQVIKFLADKAGGAHYATRVPEEFLAIGAFQGQGVDAWNALIPQIADATLAFGAQLLSSVFGIDLHLLVARHHAQYATLQVPEVLFDAQIVNTSCAFILSATQHGLLMLEVRGLEGTKVQVLSRSQISWEGLRYVHASVETHADLSTIVSLYVDGSLVGRGTSKDPLCMVPNSSAYDILMNGVRLPLKDGSMALAHYDFGKNETAAIRANKVVTLMLMSAASDPEVLVLEPGAFAHKPAGSSEIVPSGGRRATLGQFLRRESVGTQEE